MKLFDEMPCLESERIMLRELQSEDAPALEAFVCDSAIYRYLPTFLYECKYADKRYAIEHLREECFNTRTCILLAVSPLTSPSTFMGLAEIYNLGDKGHKVSVGVRLNESYWGQGYATETTRLMVDYLFDEADISVITAHVMVGNVGSGKALVKCGFVKQDPPLLENWGRDEPVMANRYMLTKDHLQKLKNAAARYAAIDANAGNDSTQETVSLRNFENDPTHEDKLILVDGLDRPLGTASKWEAHVNGLLHRAFSVVLTREGDYGYELLLSKRAATKYHSAGLWANTCCSHPRIGENTIEAAYRRVREELGCEALDLHEITAFAYRAVFGNGISEHEFDHVLIGRFSGALQLNAEEVDDARWVGIDELANELAEHPERFSAWAPIVLTLAMAYIRESAAE